MHDLLLTNANVATMDGEEPFGLVADGAIGITDGKIAWIGPSAAARPDQAAEVRDPRRPGRHPGTRGPAHPYRLRRRRP